MNDLDEICNNLIKISIRNEYISQFYHFEDLLKYIYILHFFHLLIIVRLYRIFFKFQICYFIFFPKSAPDLRSISRISWYGGGSRRGFSALRWNYFQGVLRRCCFNSKRASFFSRSCAFFRELPDSLVPWKRRTVNSQRTFNWLIILRNYKQGPNRSSPL